MLSSFALRPKLIYLYLLVIKSHLMFGVQPELLPRLPISHLFNTDLLLPAFFQCHLLISASRVHVSQYLFISACTYYQHYCQRSHKTF